MTHTAVPMHQHRQAEVRRFNQAKGWLDRPVSFGESMVMLVSEIDEANRAYYGGEGGSRVVAEFADVYIRLLDSCARFGVNLDIACDIYQDMPQRTEYIDRFETATRLMTGTVVTALEAYRAHGLRQGEIAGPEIQRQFAYLYHQLVLVCGIYGWNLDTAYDVKMAFNWTREIRHGGKWL